MKKNIAILRSQPQGIKVINLFQSSFSCLSRTAFLSSCFNVTGGDVYHFAAGPGFGVGRQGPFLYD